MARAAKLPNSEKLQLAIEQLPETQAVSIRALIDELNASGQRVVARGRAALEAMPDDEWDALVTEANDDGAV